MEREKELMREIVVDTETTGLDPFDGHRVVEIGCVELLNHLPSGKTYHVHIDPERDMPEEAFRVHGLSREFLTGKPLFSAVAPDLMGFLGDARLIIHNAPFDLKFLNYELGQCGLPVLDAARVTDTLAMARRRFPGSPASLDALCRRFEIDLSARTSHGALIDARLLGAVYLELIGGREPGLMLTDAGGDAGADVRHAPLPPRGAPLGALLTEDERAAHDEFVASLGPENLWRKLTPRA